VHRKNFRGRFHLHDDEIFYDQIETTVGPKRNPFVDYRDRSLNLKTQFSSGQLELKTWSLSRFQKKTATEMAVNLNCCANDRVRDVIKSLRIDQHVRNDCKEKTDRIPLNLAGLAAFDPPWAGRAPRDYSCGP